MLAILFALISYVCWGSGDIFSTVAARKTDAFTATFWSSIVSLVFLLIASSFFLNTVRMISFSMIMLSLLIGIIFLLGFLFFTQALIVGNAALVGTIVGSYGVISVVLSIIFFHEMLSVEQLISILLIFCGIVLSTLHYKDLLQRKVRISKGVFYAFATMILFGIWGTFIKIPVQHMGWFWPNVFMFLVFPFGIFIISKIRKTHIHSPFKKGVIIPLTTGSLFARIGELSYNIAVSKGLIAVVAPIATSYPSLFAVLAFFVFKDKIEKQQIVGIAVTLTGIIFLSFFSS